jgi:hypothetical protein
MLKDTRALVAQAVKQGKTAEQMKRDRLFDKYEELGKGFVKTDAWIDVPYADVVHQTPGAAHYQHPSIAASCGCTHFLSFQPECRALAAAAGMTLLPSRL